MEEIYPEATFDPVRPRTDIFGNLFAVYAVNRRHHACARHGGSGYIGSVITDQLLENGHDVVVLDNFVKGHRDAVHAAATLIEDDLLNERVLSATLENHRIEAVVHMAAFSLVGESMADPGKYYRNNVV